MVKYSIISLIYQSGSFADWVYTSAKRYTPLIESGQAEFFFVANDPTPSLLHHLEKKNYPHIVNRNHLYTEGELFANGYGKPEYMSRVYRGYNQGILHAKGDYVVLVNSDNYFSQDWLENLIKYSDRQNVISSKLVERKHPLYDVFPGAIHGEFGDSAENFQESKFNKFALQVRKSGLEMGGAYMPSLFHRDLLLESGLYPDGNIAGLNFKEVTRCGDEALFDRLASLGITHYTSLDSIVYHLKEGEKDDSAVPASMGVSDSQLHHPANIYTEIQKYPKPSAITRSFYIINPTARHNEIILALAGKPSLALTSNSHRIRIRLYNLLVTILHKLKLLGFAMLIMRFLRSVKKSLFR